MSISDATKDRGVHNSRVIDLIFEDSENDVIVLQMLEWREWEASRERGEELEEKFNSYLDYVLAGHFYAQYPQYSGKRVCFELSCQAEPPEELAELLGAMREFAESVNISFRLNCEPRAVKPASS